MRRGKHFIYGMMLAVCTIACSGKPHPYGGGKPYRVAILPYAILSSRHLAKAEAACRQLGNSVSPSVAITVLEPIKADSRYYYAPRQRYRADSLLNLVSSFYKKIHSDYEYLVLITDEPVSITAHHSSDYGICGLSRLGANITVLSAWHLSDIMFTQTLRHEWGHAAVGIEHCTHPNCIMNDAKGKAANLEGHTRFEGPCSTQVTCFFEHYFTGSCR